ncbi:MAG: ImmA/IrrE family metallo-endopeptidase [Verrucomicrobia bacterium]|nr:ImmA/IrrE family metallo-endopeptidase [Verrucomicrobiota bacterium]
MNDPRRFKAPYISKERIWQEADRLRAAHPAGAFLPVRALDLAEFDLGLELVPIGGLREQLDIEALLMGDLRTILVDKHGFISPRLEYRLRFSVAHEIGHLILHRDIYGGVQHATAQEWFNFISAIADQEYAWVEWQAYEFAGRLLVPPVLLREAFKTAMQAAQAAGYADWLAADEAALDYIATRIAAKFGVSAEVIAKRLRAEKLWPPN